MTKEELEGYLAEGLSLEQIGKRVGRHPSTVSHHLRKHGLILGGTKKHAPRGAPGREVLKRLSDDGLSVREIGQRLDRSPNTIRYWLAKYEIDRSSVAPGRNRRHGATGETATVIESTCKRHGKTTFALRSDGYYRCRKCSVEAVAGWRRRAKLTLVHEAGGACVICGFDSVPAALEFHHLDPSVKSFGLAAHGMTRSIAKLREEASKCVLLCANCHAAVEAGALDLPTDMTAANLTDKAA